ncbi:MAG TPA: hypothetical protein VFZ55_04905 [Nitrososphaera sp.]
MTARNKGSYGRNVGVNISLPVSIVQEVEKRRRFDSRSRFILRAVDKYLREEAREEHTGVRGSESSNQVPTAPTPSTAKVAHKNNTPLYKGGFRA